MKRPQSDVWMKVEGDEAEKGWRKSFIVVIQ